MEGEAKAGGSEFQGKERRKGEESGREKEAEQEEEEERKEKKKSLDKFHLTVFI